ncbi:type IV pilin protein [Gilvimarinus agarilyticus]|uniref:type IV pilin protein n=1 Tax=Gilvimarinus agarilyticus TaxID=679259 RepID=UPI0005A07214|nr:type IV pilin protein [Gilvimarinus agarilyticus]
MTRSKNAGFTLIEILIVVAIVGILAAIAYPSYMDSVRKSNRADAKASLNDAAQQMQRCYTLNHTFTDCPSVGTSDSAEQFYEIEVAVTGGGTGFTATATADQAPQTGDDDCLSFTLDNLGRRTSTTNGECW